MKKTPFFLILAIKSQVPQARLGIVVGKRNVKLAVDRNKLKRVIREFFRHEQELLAGMDVVVVVKKNFDALDIEKQKLPMLLKQVVQGSKCYKD